MAQSKSQAKKPHSFGVEAMAYGAGGLFLGAAIGQGAWPSLSGLGLGVVFAGWRASRAEIQSLRDSIVALEAHQAALSREQGVPPSTREATSTTPSEADAMDSARQDEIVPSVPELDPSARPDLAATEVGASDGSLQDAVEAAFAGRGQGAAASTGATATSEPPSAPSSPAPAVPSTPAGPTPFDQMFGAIRSFLFGGNTLVRVGLLVLLVGITLLAKYAADNALFPVEARLAAAALVGLGLVGVGFRQRETRPGFGMTLQGGGIAALYLVTFFAFKTYALVPAGLAFGLFVGLAIATVMLSLIQKSEPLLIIGSLGGFLAPILASTGQGNHVFLFTYYLLLNLSIAAVAWRESWRAPGVVAFLCTYGVATTWGVLRYEPADYASTQPFVVAFLALFSGIAIAHAWRRPPQLRGVIDGTLVFGTPFVSILYQSALVRDRELGLALSAAGFGLFYAALATWIWRAAPRETRPLAEAFIAVAVGFGTMAIPFAFDEALTTSIAWALEGAGLYWIGARQSRKFPRFAGITLQILAAIAFWVSALIDRVDSSEFLPLANGRALSCIALSFAGLFIAQQVFVKRPSSKNDAVIGSAILGAWGLLWWTGGLLAEIDHFVPTRYESTAILIGIAATAVAIELGASRTDWEPGRMFSLLSLPAAFIGWIGSIASQPHLLAYGGWVAWPFMFTVFYFLWERLRTSESKWLGAFRSGSLWMLGIVTATAAMGWIDEVIDLTSDWQAAAFGVGLAAVLFACLAWSRQGQSPFDRHVEHALTRGLGPVAIACLVTTLALQVVGDGNAAPIPHLPLLNPIDLTVWLLALAAWAWWKRVKPIVGESDDPRTRQAAILAMAALAFMWLNGLLARAVHQWAGVPLDLDSLWDSTPMQVSLSIAWTLVGLTGMLISSRYRLRPVWIGCAALLAVVVLKLFTVDLSQLSTVARIGTFLVVGLLLLVLGYFSPVPPSDDEAGSPLAHST